MMVLAFLYIILYGQVIFVEPNSTISHLEFVTFAIGMVANVGVGFRLMRR